MGLLLPPWVTSVALSRAFSNPALHSCVPALACPLGTWAALGHAGLPVAVLAELFPFGPLHTLGTCVLRTSRVLVSVLGCNNSWHARRFLGMLPCPEAGGM